MWIKRLNKQLRAGFGFDWARHSFGQVVRKKEDIKIIHDEDIHSLWNNIDFTKNHFNTGVVLVRLAHESMYKNTDEPNNPYRIWLEGEYEKITRPQALGLLSELKKQERK